MEFSEKDAADLAKLKQVMFDKAAEGDAHAATAFASLLNAETERSKAVAPVTQERPAMVAAGESPAANAKAETAMERGERTWRERYPDRKMPDGFDHEGNPIMAPS